MEMWKKPEEIKKRRPKVNRLLLGGFIFMINMSPVYASDDALKGSIVLSMTLLLIAGMVFIRYNGNKSK